MPSWSNGRLSFSIHYATVAGGFCGEKFVAAHKKVLFINEYGFYPELIKALQAQGYDLTVEHLMRKGISFIKKKKPDVVVAEFHHDSQFRDRVSNLESMLAQIQGGQSETKTVVFYRSDHKEYVEKLLCVHKLDAVLELPLEADELIAAIRDVSG